MTPVSDRYRQLVAAGELRPDDDQKRAVALLDGLAAKLAAASAKGSLLWRLAGRKEPPPKPDVFDHVLGALCGMGFPKRKAATVMAQLELEQAEPEAVPLIRAAVDRLTPPARFYG